MSAEAGRGSTRSLSLHLTKNRAQGQKQVFAFFAISSSGSIVKVVARVHPMPASHVSKFAPLYYKCSFELFVHSVDVTVLIACNRQRLAYLVCLLPV